MEIRNRAARGSTLVVVISVVAFLLVLIGMAVEFTGTISRESQRSRKTALAMEIADGHLEMLFTSWRNIYRGTWTALSNSSGGTDNTIVGGNYFFTALYNPGPVPSAVPFMTPSATPNPIPTPDPANFPSGTGYQLSQYRIQGVDPMITLDSSENALKETSFGSGSYVALSPGSNPPAAYGVNTWQYSYFYLASVDVTVPSTTGNVTAKVRRVFEKKFDNPWSFAMFYHDDLELQPTTALTINGKTHTNSGLYIGTSNFTTTGAVDYSSEYVNGYSPNDSYHSGGTSKPNFAKSDPSLTYSDMPPAQVSPYLPFGWNIPLVNAYGTPNTDSYHQIIEQPAPSPSPDPLSQIRYYNQACYRILIDSSNNITITKKDGTVVSTSPPLPGQSPSPGAILKSAISTNQAIYDSRESALVRLASLDVSQITTAAEAGTLPGWNGVLYIADASPNGTPIPSLLGGIGTTVTTTERGIRLINGYRLPAASFNTGLINGLTVVSANPVYIQGNYNTSTISADAVPSNSGTYTTPQATGYTRKLAAVIGDTITVLSPGWSDLNSTGSISSRGATANITINAALVGGIVPSSGGNYSGGGENFIRLAEDWKNSTMCIYGSMVELYKSIQATNAWNGAGNVYKAPQTTKYYWDPNFGSSGNVNSGPPGNLQIAAYLQQQRWYQVY